MIAWEPWVAPLSIFGGGLAIGLAVEWLGMRRLRVWTARTPWRGDDLAVESMRGLPVLWGLLIGLHIAVTAAPLAADARLIIHRLLVVGIVVSATILAMRLAAGLIAVHNGIGGRGVTIFANLARIAVLVVGALVAFQTLGVEIAPILTALGVGGLAVALALQPTLSNLFSGIQILMTKKIRTGDFIRLSSGEEGFVTDISWRETTIRTPPNNLVMIPNANLAASQVTNYSLPEPEVGFAVPVAVAHGNDLARVKRALIEEAAAVQAAEPAAVPGFVPAVVVGNLTESAIEFQVIMRTRDVLGQGGLRGALYERVLLRFAREGIELPMTRRIVVHREERLPPSAMDEAGPAPSAPAAAAR